MIELFSQNKKLLILAIGMALIFLLFPFRFAEAFSIFEWCGCQVLEALNPVCWLKCLAQTILSIPIRIIFLAIAGILGIYALITGLYYAITVFLVNWLIGISMSVGIVPGKAPAIIGIGWEFSRQLANLFFILALVFIGLATVLRIREYEAKKALPTLIIIALLINFTPVIVGFVVDMGNIVTKFFLENTGTIGIFPDILGTAWSYLKDSLYTIITIDGEFFEKFPYILAVLLSICVYGLVLVIFFQLAVFIYLLIGAVFFCRIVILWILMILSPIAFLSKVFPPGRTTKMIFPDILHWDKWWQSLIQWTIVGIPIGFFLYLSNLMITYRDDIENKFSIDVMRTNLQAATSTHAFGAFGLESAQTAELADPIVNLFAMILAPTIALVLLIMGALISLKAAPEGAKGIMQFAADKGIKRGWGGIRAGYGVIGRGPQVYDQARSQQQMGRWQAFRHAFRQTFREAGRQTWHTWRHPQKSVPPPSPPEDGGTPAAAPAAGGETTESTPTASATPSGGGAPAVISRAEKIGGEEEATAEESAATAPPPPPPESRRERAARVARGIARWVFPDRRRFLRRQERAIRIGGRIAANILKTTESVATKEIDKRMKIGKHKEEKEKTKNCPFCLKEIPIDSVFCPYCRERIE